MAVQVKVFLRVVQELIPVTQLVLLSLVPTGTLIMLPMVVRTRSTRTRVLHCVCKKCVRGIVLCVCVCVCACVQVFVISVLTLLLD